MKYFKILVQGKSCNGGKCDWFLPSKGKSGKWMPNIEGDLELCARGYHIVKAEDILDWVREDCEIYEVEPKGKVTYGDNKGVCVSARITKRLEWDDKIARSFACDCVERVLPIYEKVFPKETRVRECIQTARKFIFGLATNQELAAAWAAARAAAWDAARAAARGAEKKWQTQRLLKYLNGKIKPEMPK